MKTVNSEIKKVVSRVKEAQEQLQHLVKSQDWVEEAKKYAERQGKEVKKLFAPDVEKIRVFLERERKELERFQKQIPGEVKKFRKFINLQKKEFEKLLNNVRNMPKTGNSTKASSSRKTKSKKTKTATPRRKPSATSSGEASTTGMQS